MALLDDLDDSVQVAWFGQPWDKGCTPDIQVPDADEDTLCAKCAFKMGRKPTGAYVRDAEGDFLPYHRDCYWELLEEREAVETVTNGLSGTEW